MGEQEKDVVAGCCLSSTDKPVLGDVAQLVGGTVGAMAWRLSPGTWRWSVSPEWSCHAEIAGTAPKVKISLASPNWEQLLTTHKSAWKSRE